MTELMRAAVLVDGSDKVAVEEIPIPEPNAGEVLVKVAACGICHSDLSVVKGNIPFPRPAVIGHEISGEVVAHGPGVADTVPGPGTPVVSAFVMPCGTCAQCARGRDDLCTSFFGVNRTHGTLYDGTTRLRRTDGSELRMFSMSGMAEYAVVPATDVFALPASLPLVESAILGCATFTAFGAIRHGADLRVGQRIAVFAAGGVGLNIIQLAKAHGATEIVAVDLASDKLDAAARAGATHCVNGRETDPVDAIRDLVPGGVDVAFEALGHPETFRQAINATADGGRMVPVGLSLRDAAVPINKVVRSRVSIHGSYGARTRQDMPDLLRLVDAGHARPEPLITRRIGIDEVNDTFAALERGEIVGRAVMCNP
ncbi:zinc-binding dehydrogenase [Prauserella cavernicola]|uniref:Zinc-binding dehydrogenase n=1 Tax=Prauserella cavernicola TaxID=2800127 RepID=A0A934QYF1_9PSEU|nr:zinc-binding dehydrogenase [Prauserella cavernicola]MBK1787819.1 zinc-binding dehydrogenase [Prauserella cavernicola]